ncbi:hypothetical protein EV126DRAFT_416051 [Verticillium dahliae]|nr:hypothetical protein EV126DRAFT_416051 [Verticillium dahliae]
MTRCCLLSYFAISSLFSLSPSRLLSTPKISLPQPGWLASSLFPVLDRQSRQMDKSIRHQATAQPDQTLDRRRKPG